MGYQPPLDRVHLSQWCSALCPAAHLTEGIFTPTRLLPPRMCEYVDHLHEHFKYPVLIREASYMPPKVSL